MSNNLIDVLDRPERIVEPSAAEVISALNAAGHSFKMRETHLRLSAEVPYVKNRGHLEFRGGWSLMPNLGTALCQGNSIFSSYMDIVLTPLEWGVTYGVSVFMEMRSTLANPRYLVRVSSGSAAVHYFKDAKPYQTLALTMTALPGSITVRIEPWHMSVWMFHAATFYEP